MDPKGFTRTLRGLVTILMVTYPYTLNLTAPASVVTNSNQTTRCKILFGNKRRLRLARRVATIILSGAKAIARNGPMLASIVVRRGIRRGAFLRLMKSTRGRSRRPLTRTVMGKVGSGKVVLFGPIRFRTVPKCKVGTEISKGSLLVNAEELVSGCSIGIRSTGLSVRALRRGKGATVLITISNGCTNVITITSAVGRASESTVGHLEGLNVRIVVVAKSGGHATRTVTSRINVSSTVTRILPRNGTRRMGGLRGRKGGMTVINSNVGSTPTLTMTSVNVTVKANASITVRTTSVALVENSLGDVTSTVLVDGGAVEGVGRGLF